MKKTVYGLLLLLPALLLVGCGREKPEGDIAALSYSYGSFHGGHYEYTVQTAGEYALFSAEGSNGVELEVYNARLPAETMNRLAGIVERHRLWDWNGFDKNDPDILDGYSFGLHIQYGEEQTVTAQGYMRNPRGYEEAHAELAEFFAELAAQHQYQPVDWGEITRFGITASEEGRIYSYQASVDMETGAAHFTAEVTDAGGNTLEEWELVAGSEWMASLERTAADHQLDSWNGFDIVAGQAGLEEAFSLHILDTNGNEIVAHGVGAYPDNFEYIRYTLFSIFEGIRAKAA